MKFLITFYSHYQAVKARRQLKEKGYEVSLISVPRSVSSSCGTAALCDCGIEELKQLEVEDIYKVVDGGYEKCLG